MSFPSTDNFERSRVTKQYIHMYTHKHTHTHTHTYTHTHTHTHTKHSDKNESYPLFYNNPTYFTNYSIFMGGKI